MANTIEINQNWKQCSRTVSSTPGHTTTIGNLFRGHVQKWIDWYSSGQLWRYKSTSICILSSKYCLYGILSHPSLNLLCHKQWKICNERNSQNLVNIFHSYSFVSTISKPTRVTNTSSIIDHIWTNNFDNYITSGIIFNSISDRSPIFSSFKHTSLSSASYDTSWAVKQMLYKEIFLKML